jgi:hypothetical protein
MQNRLRRFSGANRSRGNATPEQESDPESGGGGQDDGGRGNKAKSPRELENDSTAGTVAGDRTRRGGGRASRVHRSESAEEEQHSVDSNRAADNESSESELNPQSPSEFENRSKAAAASAGQGNRNVRSARTAHGSDADEVDRESTARESSPATEEGRQQEFVIRWKNAVDEEDIPELLSPFEVTEATSAPRRKDLYRVTITLETSTTEEVIEAIKKMPGISIIEPNYRYQPNK